jgi:hypothetical protein
MWWNVGQGLGSLFGKLGLQGVEIIPLEAIDSLQTHPFCIDNYNAIMKSTEIWDDLILRKVDMALTIQDDGFLVRPGVEQIMIHCLQHNYHYVGAPWCPIRQGGLSRLIGSDTLVGNGGLSLRRPSMMAHIASRSSEIDIMILDHNNHSNSAQQRKGQGPGLPEDVFFAKGVIDTGNKLPPSALASVLSSEQVLNQRSLEFHKPWPYHPSPCISMFFESARREALNKAKNGHKGL